MKALGNLPSTDDIDTSEWALMPDDAARLKQDIQHKRTVEREQKLAALNDERCYIWPEHHAVVEFWQQHVCAPSPPWLYAGMNGVRIGLDFAQLRAMYPAQLTQELVTSLRWFAGYVLEILNAAES